jgi:hypothetical protein
MIRKLSRFLFLILMLCIAGCTKDTYNMDKLSGKTQLSPTFGITAVNGDVSFSDMVHSNDTIVFDQNNFVSVVFKEDSVIDLKLADFYDLNDMVSFSQKYQLGELSIAPFYQTLNFSLDAITKELPAPIRNLFVARNNTTNVFPAFPSVDLKENDFPLIPNFENAVFSSGILEISIRNNLNAPLTGLTIQLYNSSGHTPIGNLIIISTIQPDAVALRTIDLAGQTLSNSIIMEIVLAGSPGTFPHAVPINLSEDNVEVGIRGKDLKVKSGRVILPDQTIESLDNKDTIDFNPGAGIEIEEIQIDRGRLMYHVESTIPITAAVDVEFPTILRSNSILKETLNLTLNGDLDGSILVDNTFFNLGDVQEQPYNKVPLIYSILISSNGQIIDFDWQDNIIMDFKLLNPGFNYVKGYFSQQEETIDEDVLDLDIEDVLKHLTGDLLISNPSIKLIYSNSFAIPAEFTLNATGERDGKKVDLNLDPNPIEITSPAAPLVRDVTDTITIDNNNSALDKLVSLPPEKITFSGSATMNPGVNDGLRNSYVFGDSRFVGSLEVEVPMEFRMNNFALTDTVDNFIVEDIGKDSPIKPEDFEFMGIDLKVKNGFPLGASINICLYDSTSNSNIDSIIVTDFLKPAPVDSFGEATGFTEASSSIEITDTFFSSAKEADKIIFKFILNTTENTTKFIRIYSDYRISFTAAVVLKPVINFE